ncbi:alpha/beta hydrolase [Congregibacter brevis]|uniref:Alpha/beta hydrolase n=1 Tax=Congregibacter brevis TaxID=3081201 RepID=A0ABZ0I735_9GAMM|nr:alpha/beta hydrolase [Congregibacter sp. IMCC45268]
MKTEKGIVEYDRFAIPYRRYGDHPNVLICVSGILQTMAVWRAVAKRFSPHFSVIIFDMPGVGRSQILSGGAHVTVDEQVQVVHALVQHANPQGELTLAGSSWGTAIAAGYAAKYPDAVQKLVLSSFGMQPNAEMESIIDRAKVLYASRDFAAGAELIVGMFGQEIGLTYKRQIASQFENLSDANADAFYEHCLNIMSLGHLKEAIDLTKISARTLIVNGSEDRIIDLGDMWEAKEIIAHCECLLIEGAGHFLHFEREEILDDYEDFLLGVA